MGLPYGISFVGTVLAWDTSANAFKTGDSANISTSWVKDGTRSATSNGNAETDATNCPGEYKVTLTATEAQCLTGVLCGKSTTANIVIIPLTYTFVRVPNVDAGTTNGLFIAGTNAATTITTALTTTFTGNVTGSVGSVTGLTASDVGAIKTKTDFLPSATAGAAGGVFIAGTNAATTITTALTTTFTGSLTGSVASVTGNVGGNVVGSVGSIATGGITTGSFAAAALDSSVIATSFKTAIADTAWTRDLSAITRPGGGVRYPLQAIDAIRNKVDTTVTPAVIYQNDDSTASFTTTLTLDGSALPVTKSTP